VRRGFRSQKPEVRRLFLGTLCVAVASAVSAGTTYYVDGTYGDNANDGLSITNNGVGQGPKKNLSAVLAVAGTGDVIQVASGIYQEANWLPSGQEVHLSSAGPVIVYQTDPWQTDSVGDGVADGWRQYYFGNGTTTNGSSCAQCDPDNDGFTNLEEYQAGYSPVDTNSHPSAILTIPNAWAIYTATSNVEVTADIRSTNRYVTVKAAEYFLDSTNGVTFGTGYSMIATDGVFNSTNEMAVGTFTPSFPYGERHEIFIHARGKDKQWSPFKRVIINPNINDILDKIQENYSAFQDLQFNVTMTEKHNGVTVRTTTAAVKMKGPYMLRTEYDNGFVGIVNTNRMWWHNDALNIGGAMTAGINGDFSPEGSRCSDFFWDVPLSKTRTDASITISDNSATFDCALPPKTGVLWPSLGFVTDYRIGVVTQQSGRTEDVEIKSEFLNPIEVFPGKWLFTLHKHTMMFDSGDVIVFESAITNVQANQGLDDSLFYIPSE
jgi:hypothetical protein